MPGLIGRAYAEKGGTVHYVGKPHPAVYRACFQALQLADDEASSDAKNAHAEQHHRCFSCRKYCWNRAEDGRRLSCSMHVAGARTFRRNWITVL